MKRVWAPQGNLEEPRTQLDEDLISAEDERKNTKMSHRVGAIFEKEKAPNPSSSGREAMCLRGTFLSCFAAKSRGLADSKS